MASQPVRGAELGVVIPTRNRPAALQAALRSVLEQEGAAVRVVVVDEASEPPVDRSCGLVADPRVTVVRNDEPIGPGAARNLGVDHLDTAIVSFLDDDDEWEPTKARRCLDAFEQFPDVSTVAHRARVQGEPLRERGTGSVQVLTDPVATWLRAQSPHPDCVAIRRDVHVRVRFDETFPAAADLDYMLRLAQEAPVAMIDAVLAVHGAPTELDSSISLDRRIAGRLQFRSKHADLFQSRDVEAFHLLRLGHLHRRNGDRRGAVAAFTRSFVTRPSMRSLRGLVMALLPGVARAATRSSRATRRPGVHDVVITNVYSDDNRGGAAITAATVDAVRDAFPDASIGLVTMLNDGPASAGHHRHTEQTVDADTLPAAIRVGGGRLGPSLAVLRSLVTLGFGRRLIGGTPTLRRLADADVVVAKGGQLFRPFSWRGLPGLWLSGFPLVFARRCGVPTAAFAISIGPFQPNRAGRASSKVVGLILRRCSAVLARDDASLELAIELGVPSERVHRVPDAVFATEPPPAELTAEVLQRIGLDGARFVAITATNHMSIPEAEAVINPELVSVVRALLDGGVVDRVAVVLQTDGAGTSDRTASLRFLELLSDDRAVLVDEDFGVAELMALYRGARLTIGGRVHSNIFSVVVGTPAFPFEYWGSKALNLFEPIGLGDLVLRIEEGCAPAIGARVTKAMADETAIRERVRTAGEALRVESKRSVDLLRSITEGR